MKRREERRGGMRRREERRGENERGLEKEKRKIERRR
jgi:hypothetical protein